MKFGFFIILFIVSCQNQEMVNILIPGNVDIFDTTLLKPIRKDQIELGKKLFFDKRLSLDSSISCGSCHLPELAFTDGKPISEGYQGKKSRHNASTLFNIALSPSFMFDNRAQTLETQSLIPIHDPNEMNFDIYEISKRLSNDLFYKEMSKKAFNDSLSPFVITRSLAAFIRSLVVFDRPIDSFYKTKDKRIFSKSAWLGYQLFIGKANCVKCHEEPLYTNHLYYNLNLEDSNSTTFGLYGATHDKKDMYRFKTPTLRYISKTAPYFHNGKFNTLEAVLDYKIDPKNNTFDYNPPNLNDAEKKEIVVFLKEML
jgi:cytochrome c peroxidase